MALEYEQHAPITVAITGASGAPYALRLLQCLVAAKRPVYVMVSKAAQVVFATETQVKLPGTPEKMQAHLTMVCTRCQWFGSKRSNDCLPLFNRNLKCYCHGRQ